MEPNSETKIYRTINENLNHHQTVKLFNIKLKKKRNSILAKQQHYFGS